MRILLVSNLYAPDKCGGAQSISDLATDLVRRGHEVTVRCAYPYYPEWCNKSGQNGWRVRRELVDGVAVERYGLYIPQRPSRLADRLLYEGTFLLSILRSLPRGKHDVAFVYCPSMSSVAFGALNRLLRRTPAVLCVHDLPTDAAVAGGIMKRSALARLFGGVEHWLFGQYATWRTISPVMVERLTRMGGRPIHLIPEWVHPTLGQALRSGGCMQGRNGQLQLLYSGNIGNKQGLPDFCRALAKCQTDFVLRINGAGGGMEQVRLAVAGDRRFILGGLTSEAEFASALQRADLYVVTERPTGAAFFPSKTIPSMIVGTPILAVSSAHSPLGTEMLAHRLGPWLPWDRISELDAVLGGITSETLAQWQDAAIKRSRYYDRQHCIDQLESVLVSVAHNK